MLAECFGLTLCGEIFEKRGVIAKVSHHTTLR